MPRGRRHTLYSDERIATAMVIFIWGSYVEVASLSSQAIVVLGQRPDLIHEVHSEVAAAGLLRRSLPSTLSSAAQADPAKGTATGALALENDWGRWALPFTTGVLRESLCLQPPAGGGFRVATEQINIAGYDIEAGTVVTADPRISNLMDALHAQPSLFEPRRWVVPSPEGANAAAVEGTDASRCPFAGLSRSLGANGWHPGGIGSHSCPGVPLAELFSRVFVARWVERFESWGPAGGTAAPPEYELIPIKIPVDDYTVAMKARDRAGAGRVTSLASVHGMGERPRTECVKSREIPRSPFVCVKLVQPWGVPL